MSGLITGEIEADDALIDKPAGDLSERDVLRRGHVSQRRDDDPALEAEGLAAGSPAAQHGTHDIRERETLLHVEPGTVANLGVANVIVLQVLTELIRRAFQRRDGLQHGDGQLEVFDVLDERGRAVRSLQEVLEFFEISSRKGNTSLLRHLQDGLWPNRAIEVKVQLGLRDRVKVGGVVHRSSAVCYQSPFAATVQADRAWRPIEAAPVGRPLGAERSGW